MSAKKVPGDVSSMADELDKPEKVPQSTELVRLAETSYRFAVADDGRTFAVALDGPNLARPLRGGDGLRQELSRAYYVQHKRVPSATALADALTTVEGIASLADREPLALRVAVYGAGIVLDLGTADGRAVVVDRHGWQVVDRSPVVFRRTELTKALPTPVRGGRLDELREVVNISDGSWPLLVGWLVAALLPEIPHPIVLVTGLQGSGKSTAAANIATVVDPSAAPLQSPPTDPSSFTLTASGSWVVVLDNVSGVAGWLSDALCRAVTGDARVARQLYSDSSLTVVAIRRCIVLTTIDAGALRGDLAERLLTLELERIGPTERRTDTELRQAADGMGGRVLGALLDLLVQVLPVLGTVELRLKPRMADFAAVLAAIDQVTGTHALDTYLAQSDSLAADVVADDPVASAVVALVAEREHWSGSPTQLLDELTRRTFPDDKSRRPKQWPSTAAHLSGALKRAAVQLATVGVSVTTGHVGRGKGKQRSITLSRTDGSPGAPFGDDTGTGPQHHGAASPPVSSPDDGVAEQGLWDGGDGGDDGDDGPAPLSVRVVELPWEPLQPCPYCALVTYDAARETCANPQCDPLEPF